MNLEAFVLGTGGMMPLPKRFLTSVLVRREGELFLFDCGEATQISLRKLNLKWKKITAIFISHTHADHITGLPGILMLSSQVDREEPLYIYGPPKIREYIEASRRTLDMYINYEIIVKELSEEGICYNGDGFSISSFKLEHTKPCLGYTLTEDFRPGIFYPEKAEELNIPKGPLWSILQNGNAITLSNGDKVFPEQVLGVRRNGRKFSYVTDSLYLEKISYWVKNSDLFICEGMFRHELKEDAAEKKHMTSVQAAKCALNAGGVKKMGLIHYSPRYIEHDLRLMLKEARKIFPDTFLTRDGQHIVIQNEE